MTIVGIVLNSKLTLCTLIYIFGTQQLTIQNSLSRTLDSILTRVERFNNLVLTPYKLIIKLLRFCSTIYQILGWSISNKQVLYDHLKFIQFPIILRIRTHVAHYIRWSSLDWINLVVTYTNTSLIYLS